MPSSIFLSKDVLEERSFSLEELSPNQTPSTTPLSISVIRIDEIFSFLEEKDYANSCFHLFPLLINFNKIKISKKDLFLKLQENGLHLQVHYIPVHLQPFYQKLGFKEGDFPNAEEYYKKTISLPVYYGLNDGDLSVVVDIVKQLA